MKQIIILMTTFLLVGSTVYSQCLSGNCVNGKGLMLYPDGQRFYGQFSQSKRHGEGVMYYTNGSRYQGQWMNDLPHGRGVKLFEDGTRLVGVWEQGRLARRGQPTATAEEYASRGTGQSGCISGDCANGKGIYIYPSGAIYIGEFSQGEIHGVGVCYYSDGSKYQGQWAHRYPEGKGTKTFPDGAKRTGHWQKGKPVDQYGNLVMINDSETKDAPDAYNTLQTGCIEGNCRNGQGVFAYSNGSRYEGQFYRGKPEGWGTFFSVNGDKYSGGFQSGYRHGRGKLEKKNGMVEVGEWRNGEFVGASIPAAGTGCIRGNCRDGYGTYIYEDGSKYIGTFQNFLPHGKGIVYYTNGERYEGEMADAAFNGQGTLFLTDGSKVTGQWENGTYKGIRGRYSPLGTNGATEPDPFAESLPKVKVWAVVIGVASYNHMPVLRYTDDDAYRIYAFLKSPEGGALDDSQIRILIDEDATKESIIEAMSKTFGMAGPNDLVVLYFSGHGLKGSFLPFDFDGYNNKLYHEEINEILQKSPAKYKLCIADACHSGSLLAMRDGEKNPAALLSYYQNLAKAQPGTALIMSSKSDETSLESSGLRQGVFSHFLIRGLKGEADRDGNQLVTVQELFDFVHNNVRSYTGQRQSPVIQGDYDKTMTVAVKR